jgi:hypothetical protein
MAETPNHEYNVPGQGDQNWHVPLNDNFEAFEVDIELRDGEANLSSYTPTAGAKFLATDTGVVYVGDGSDWVPQFVFAAYDPSTGTATVTPTLVASELDVETITGQLTGGTQLSTIAGDNLSIDSNGQLNASTSGGGGGISSLSGGDGINPSSINDGDSLSVAWGDATDLDSSGAVDTISGSVTSGTTLTDIAGNNLSISNGQLNATTSGGGISGLSGGDGINPNSINDGDTLSVAWGNASGLGSNGEITGGNWAKSNNVLSPSDSNVVGVDVDEVNADLIAASGPATVTVGGERALELTAQSGADAGNIIAGHSTNSVASDVVGGAILSGGFNDGNNDDSHTLTGDNSVIAGGTNNEITGFVSAIAGGSNNTAGTVDAIGGGTDNNATGTWTAIPGGVGNDVTGRGGVAAGGHNEVSGEYAVVAGGGGENSSDGNTVYDDHGTISGGLQNRVGQSSGGTAATGSTIGGGQNNQIDGTNSIIGGGAGNEVNAEEAVVGGGEANTATGYYATVAGGSKNEATAQGATVGGGGGASSGTGNTASGQYSTVAGGTDNGAGGNASFVGGGSENAVSGTGGTVCGGSFNVVSGDGATVPGGQQNSASGNYSFATGRKATASDPGSFVVGDSTSTEATSFRADEARFQIDLRTSLLKTESSVFYVPGENSAGADWRTTYDTDNDRWMVDRWNPNVGTFGSFVNKMWVTSSGDVKASGSKDFVETVDTDDGEKEVHYTAMESGTPHTETAGVAELEDGRAEIELPDHFDMVTSDDEPLVVQTTPYASEPVQPQVTKRSTERVVIEDFSEGADDYEVAYTVKGTRDGYEDKEVVREPAPAAESTKSPEPADD